MANVYITYCNGPVFYKTRDITKGDIYCICKQLSKKFGFTVLPSGSHEGGLQLCVDGNKCLRFYGNKKWPSVQYEEFHSDWPDNTTSVLNIDVAGQKPNVVTTFLKALDGASIWTQDELNAVMEIFCANGFKLKCKNSRLTKQNGAKHWPPIIEQQTVIHYKNNGIKYAFTN